MVLFLVRQFSIYLKIKSKSQNFFTRTFALVGLNTVTPTTGGKMKIADFFIEKVTCQNRKKIGVGDKE